MSRELVSSLGAQRRPMSVRSRAQDNPGHSAPFRTGREPCRDWHGQSQPLGVARSCDERRFTDPQPCSGHPLFHLNHITPYAMARMALSLPAGFGLGGYVTHSRAPSSRRPSLHKAIIAFTRRRPPPGLPNARDAWLFSLVLDKTLFVRTASLTGSIPSSFSTTLHDLLLAGPHHL